eukprot:gene13588-14964_t
MVTSINCGDAEDTTGKLHRLTDPIYRLQTNHHELCQRRLPESLQHYQSHQGQSQAGLGLSKEDTLDQLINFEISSGSFTYNLQSLQLTLSSRADLQRLISEQQHYQSASSGSGQTGLGQSR